MPREILLVQRLPPFVSLDTSFIISSVVGTVMGASGVKAVLVAVCSTGVLSITFFIITGEFKISCLSSGFCFKAPKYASTFPPRYASAKRSIRADVLIRSNSALSWTLLAINSALFLIEINFSLSC